MHIVGCIIATPDKHPKVETALKSHLQVADVSDGCDLLKARPQHFQASGHVFIKQDRQVRPLRLQLA